MNASGLPHSDIPGSKPVCGSPELFAASHVFHRDPWPRHSPYALSSLTIAYENSRCGLDALHTVQQRESCSAPCVECVVGKSYRLQDIQLSKTNVVAGLLSSARTSYPMRP